MTEALSLSFFIYSVLLMLTCAYASSASLCSYLLTRGRTYLALMILFSFYLLEVGVGFAWGFSGFPDLNYETEGMIGQALLLIEVVLSTGLIASVLWAIFETMGIASKCSVLLPAGAFAAFQVANVLAIKSQPLYQWLQFSARSLIIIGAMIWAYRIYLVSPEGPVRQALSKLRCRYAVIMALLVATLAYDGIVYACSDYISQLDPDTFLRYLCERNLFENALIVFSAISTIRSCSIILALRFKEPPVGSPQIDEVRMARFADRFRLTPAERMVAAHLIEGHKLKVIASELIVSEGTVKTHLSHIYKKAECSNRTELLQRFWEC